MLICQSSKEPFPKPNIYVFIQYHSDGLKAIKPGLNPIIGGGLPPPNLLYGISTIRLLKIANLITS